VRCSEMRDMRYQQPEAGVRCRHLSQQLAQLSVLRKSTADGFNTYMFAIYTATLLSLCMPGTQALPSNGIAAGCMLLLCLQDVSAVLSAEYPQVWMS